MQYNFTDLTAFTIDDKAIPEIDKLLANSIYSGTKDLGLVTVAQDIYRGKDVEITLPQIEEIKRIVQDEKTGFFAFVQKAILDFLDNPTSKK